MNRDVEYWHAACVMGIAAALGLSALLAVTIVHRRQDPRSNWYHAAVVALASQLLFCVGAYQLVLGSRGLTRDFGAASYIFVLIETVVLVPFFAVVLGAAVVRARRRRKWDRAAQPDVP